MTLSLDKLLTSVGYLAIVIYDTVERIEIIKRRG